MRSVVPINQAILLAKAIGGADNPAESLDVTASLQFVPAQRSPYDGSQERAEKVDSV
jgi:hypothetical protein